MDDIAAIDNSNSWTTIKPWNLQSIDKVFFPQSFDAPPTTRLRLLASEKQNNQKTTIATLASDRLRFNQRQSIRLIGQSNNSRNQRDLDFFSISVNVADRYCGRRHNLPLQSSHIRTRDE